MVSVLLHSVDSCFFVCNVINEWMDHVCLAGRKGGVVILGGFVGVSCIELGGVLRSTPTALSLRHMCVFCPFLETVGISWN
jgi:hypothetical protein